MQRLPYLFEYVFSLPAFFVVFAYTVSRSHTRLLASPVTKSVTDALMPGGNIISVLIRPLRALTMLALLLLTFLGAQCVYAADISRDVRAGREDESLTNDGYLEISTYAILNQMPIPGADDLIVTVGLGGHYRYRAFFIDAYAESYNQFQFGLNAYSGDVWSIDLLAASSEHGVDSELNRELKQFSDRDAAGFLGLRATGYNDPYIFQAEILNDVSDVHGGSLVTASIARTWLYHNWNFHALLGSRYESQATLNYQFGNDAADATENYPAYSAGSGTTFVTEFGVTYPINEHFIFKATGRWWELPSAVVSSPFITNDSYLTFTSTITFVY